MMQLVLFSCLLATAFAGALPRPRLDGRIVGGTATSIDKYPHQISLQVLGSHSCGGSIISKEYILTAGHCVGYPSSWYSIRAGSTNRGSGGSTYSVSRVVRHPQYSSSTIDYDFAVIQIAGTFDASANEVAVALPQQDEAVSAGTPSICTGWGALTEGGSSPTVLQEVAVPIVDQAACNEAYGGDITARMICAGVPEGGRDACQGDSGGPLVASNKLIGVVSWGYGCARPNYPGVYSRVASVRNWIKENSDV